MALTWDLTRCAEGADVLWSDERKAVTHTLIMSTIGIGIGDWTEGNAPEVYARIHVLEAIYGAFVRAWGGEGQERKPVDRPITPDDVRALVGLRTNVGPLESRASFLRRHISGRGGWLDDLTRSFTNSLKKESAA